LLEVVEMPEAIRCLVFCAPEAVEGRLCWLEVMDTPKGTRRALLCMLDAVRASSVCWSYWRCRRRYAV